MLVNLWATWCGPCIVEMPSLDALARRRGEDLKVLALSQDLDGRQKVTDFFAARRFTRLEPYLDPDLRFMTELGVDTLPTTILYDAEGVEVWRMTGMADWDSERATRLLEAEGRRNRLGRRRPPSPREDAAVDGGEADADQAHAEEMAQRQRPRRGTGRRAGSRSPGSGR